MADIDLLVPVEVMPRLGEIMARLGYQRQGLYYTDEFNASHGYHLIFRRPAARDRPVEIHWELASRPERRNRLTAALLLAHAIPGTQAALAPGDPMWRRHARVLSPEAQIVYLASHMASEGHAFGRLIWLADMAATISATSSLSWLAVAALARRARSCRASGVAAALVHSLCGVCVPRQLSVGVRPGRLTSRLIDKAINPATILQPLNDERRAGVKYLLVDSPALTVRLISERLFPNPMAMQAYYRPATRIQLGAAYIRHAAGLGYRATHKALGSYAGRGAISAPRGQDSRADRT